MEHPWQVPMEASYVGLAEMAGRNNPTKFEDGVVWNYIPEKLYGGADTDAPTIEAPNEIGETTCKAVLYLQSNRSRELNNKNGCEAVSYVQQEVMCGAHNEHYGKLIKNDFMTQCRSLVEYVIKMIGWWTLGIMNQVYAIMSPHWMRMTAGIPQYEETTSSAPLHG